MRTPTRTITAAAVALTAAGILAGGSAVAADTTTSAAKAGAAKLSDYTATPGGVIRVAGANRYETAVEISKANWAPTTTYYVFLASGNSSADALALGPSTFMQGPLLLTEKDRLPEATRAEIARLKPCYLVVAGGVNAVSDAVVKQAEAYVDPTAAHCVPA